MSWIVAGLAVGGALYKGYSATQNMGDVQAGVNAAGDIYQEQLGFLGDVRKQTTTSAQGAYGEAMEGIGLGAQAAQSQFAGGQRDIAMGMQTGMRNIGFGTSNIQQGAATASSRSGLATSGTIQQQTAMQMGQMRAQEGDIMGKYKSDMTKLFDTKGLAREERELQKSGAARQLEETKAEADLAYRSGQMSAEDAYQSTLTGFQSQPTTFLEGMFS